MDNIFCTQGGTVAGQCNGSAASADTLPMRAVGRACAFACISLCSRGEVRTRLTHCCTSLSSSTWSSEGRQSYH